MGGEEVNGPAPKHLPAPQLDVFHLLFCISSLPSSSLLSVPSPLAWIALMDPRKLWLPLRSTSGDPQQETGGKGGREVSWLLVPGLPQLGRLRLVFPLAWVIPSLGKASAP